MYSPPYPLSAEAKRGLIVFIINALMTERNMFYEGHE